eukprot:m.255558 g.255558  ORF g.255558 m.255558 type:complete len:1075 (-) comp17558_c0_seq6:2441-5665(-)
MATSRKPSRTLGYTNSLAKKHSNPNGKFENERLEQARDWAREKQYFAAKNNFVEVIKRFEQTLGSPSAALEIYLNERDTVGATPLHVAVLCGSLDVAQYLTETHGPKLVQAGYAGTASEGVSLYDGETALHLAIVKGYFDFVKLLVMNSADINATVEGTFFDQDEEDKGIYLGSTPLHFAICCRRAEIAEYLLNHQANPAMTDKYGNTALHLAVWYEFPELYDLVSTRNYGYDVDLETLANMAGLTPLKMAADRGSKIMLKHILRRRRELAWSFGPVREYHYEMNELDQDFSDKAPSVIEILVSRGTYDHALLLKEHPLLDILDDKWARRVRYKFYSALLLYIGVVSLMTYSLLNTPPDPNFYSDDLDGDLRLIFEIVVLGFAILETFFEVRDIIYSPARHRSFQAGSVVFNFAGWLFRLFLVLAAVLRALQADPSSQRAVLSFVGVLGWLQMLNFGRGIQAVGRFILMTEHMAMKMANWVLVFILELVAFAVAFQVLYNGKPVEGFTTEISTVPLAMFTLTKWVLGEVAFEAEDANRSASAVACFVLFVSFVALMTTILFNILIALMTNVYEEFVQQADALSVLQYAHTIITLERKSSLFWGPAKVGRPGIECGHHSDRFYQAVLERLDIDVNGESCETDQYDLAEEEQYQLLRQAQGQPKHVPGFQVQADDAAAGNWDALMDKIPQESPNGNYITDFAELDDMFKAYNVYAMRSCTRETAAFMLQDMCLNQALDGFRSRSMRTRKDPLQKRVQELSEDLVRVLDQDSNDEIPMETFATFARLSRLGLLLRADDKPKTDKGPKIKTKLKTALIIVDFQNDFVNGVFAVEHPDQVGDVCQRIQQCRKSVNLVFRVEEQHPPDHISFASESEKPTVVAAHRDEEFKVPELVYATWPPHCIKGEDGANVYSGLATEERDVVIPKSTASDKEQFSGFWDEPRTSQTPLLQQLFDQDVVRVFVCGLGLGVGVARTARDAAAYGFETFVVGDASLHFHESWAREAALELEGAGVQLCTSSSVPELCAATRSPEARKSLAQLEQLLPSTQASKRLMGRTSTRVFSHMRIRLPTRKNQGTL